MSGGSAAGGGSAASGTTNRAKGRTPVTPPLALPRLGSGPSPSAIAVAYNQAASQIEAADRGNLKRMQEGAFPAFLMVSQPSGRTWRVWLDDSGGASSPVFRISPA